MSDGHAHLHAHGHGPEVGRPRRWLTALVSLAILAAGAGGAFVLVRTRPRAVREASPRAAPLVEVIHARSGSHAVSVKAQGEVTPARTLVVMSEVGGRIVWQNDRLVPGGLIAKGEPLVRIDPRDYSLAVRQQEVLVSSQSLQLELERGRHEIAKKEWELYEKERHDAGAGALLPLPLPPPQGTGSALPEAGPPPLALRQPHYDSAKVAMRGAESGLEKARLMLSRTSLTAPFNAVVESEAVELQQLALPQAQLATLVGTDLFWVKVALPLSELAHVRLPKDGAPGSSVRVYAETGKGRIHRTGSVSRLLGGLEPSGRLARLFVDVPDPFRLGTNAPVAVGDPRGSAHAGTKAGHALAEGRPVAVTEEGVDLPLFLGSFVHVEIEGGTLEDVIELPRRALEPESRVLVVDEEDKLASRRVEVVFGDEDTVLVRGELKEGERVVVSPLAAPVIGMKLRVAAPSASPPATLGQAPPP